MTQITRILIANHTHHDIGFNDYQDVAFRQHGEFVRDALDLIEATADRRESDRYRWVCEVTGPLIRYLREAGPAEQDRFRYWQRQGSIDVAAMQYNLTPLLTPEQMRRSLYPVRVLREEMGIEVETAMQDDVNGISWLFADLLPMIGINFLTMAINQSRGRAPRPFPGGFWWEGPAGNRLLTWNGFHYLFGRSQAKLGDWRFVDESLPPYLEALEQDESFPFDTLYVESTHPMRVDNGPPDARMAEFVRQWNGEGRAPALEFATPRIFRDYLRDKWGGSLPTRRGDWTDWWADGAASSAYETGLNRVTHELLSSAETLASWLIADGRRPELAGEFVERVYETMTLYDEHTWGAFSSIDAPASLFTKAQWNRKANFAYDAAMHTHDMLTRSARELADGLATRLPEGRFNLGDLDTDAAYPTDPDARLLVFNTLPYERSLIVEVPEFRSGGAPGGMLESFFPRDVPWGGPPHTDLARRRLTVPGGGYAFTPVRGGIDDDDLVAEEFRIENEAYVVVIDQRSGAIASWIDKESGHDYADTMPEGGLGQLVHETVDSPLGRDALYLQDFSSWDFGFWQQHPPFDRRTPDTVRSIRTFLEPGYAVAEVAVELRGCSAAALRIALPSRQRALHVDWHVNRLPVTDPESLYVLFPMKLDGQRYTLDVNGVPLAPDIDQLPGAVRDFYPLRRWADVSDGVRGVTLVTLEAPLLQLGGITTNHIADSTSPDTPGFVSWAMNNHWMVNFKASQEGEAVLRYRLTTHEGACDPAQAQRFAETESVAPVVLRDYVPRHDERGVLLGLPEKAGVEATVKPATFGDGLIVRLRNNSEKPVEVPVDALKALGDVEPVGVLEEPVSEPPTVLAPSAEASFRIL